MGVIRIHQPHTRDWLARAVTDAMSIVGERLVVLEMKSPRRTPDEPRCQFCYDDIYGNSATSVVENEICPWCLGSTYEGGISRAVYTSGIIGKPLTSDFPYDKRGDYQTQKQSARVEWPSAVYRNDFVLRVSSWTQSIKPGAETLSQPASVEVFKVVSSTQKAHVKDGKGYTGPNDIRVGTSFSVELQSPDHPAYQVELPGMSTRLVSSRTPFAYVPDSTERLTAPTTREL